MPRLLASLQPKMLPLTPYEYEISEPYGEVDEGVIERILEIIGAENRYCIEFGAGDGWRHLVVRNLIERHGFGALLIEGEPDHARRSRQNHAARENVQTVEAYVSPENIDAIIRASDCPPRPDIMVIDIDGNDYHVWRAIASVRPRIVCIEFNASYPPPRRFVVDYDADLRWAGDDFHSASIQSLVDLGREKGYELIHCTAGGVNLYFADAPLYDRFGLTDNSPAAIYQLPLVGKYGRSINGKGHPASRRNTTASRRLWYRLRYYLTYPLRRVGQRRFREIMAENRRLRGRI